MRSAGRPLWPACTVTCPGSRAILEEGLEAAYSELTGEAYRSQEEEQADNVREAKEQRGQLRIEAQLKEEQRGHPRGQGQRRVYGLPRDTRCAWMGQAEGQRFLLFRYGGCLPLDKGRGRGSRVCLGRGRAANHRLGIPLRLLGPRRSRTFFEVKEQWDADRAIREQKSWADAFRAKAEFRRTRKRRNWPSLLREQSARPCGTG